MELSVRNNVIILNSGAEGDRPGPVKVCVDSWHSALTALLPAHYCITSICITALKQQVTSGALDEKTVAAVVLPGGNTIGYFMYKNAYETVDCGYQMIKKWCEKDGIALICSCAGAIFAGHGCCDLDFKTVKFTDSFAPIVIEKWASIGMYQSPLNAIEANEMACALLKKAVPLREAGTDNRLKALFVGGPGWIEMPGDTVHAWYEDVQRGENLAAVLSRKLGKGTLVFMGPHLEYGFESEWKIDSGVQDELRSDQDVRQNFIRVILRVSGLQIGMCEM